MLIKDVAREAGVSTATVSHVINNSRPVAKATRLKVERAIERCNYYPNAHARSLASGRSHTLGLVVSDISNPFFPELAKSIETAAFEHGYDLILSNTNYDAARTSRYVRRIIERKVAGVAVMTSELDPLLIDELARREVSVVFLDLGFAGAHMSNLIVDYRTGVEEAVGYLYSLGHRRFGYIGGPRHLRSASKRLEAFQHALGGLPGVDPGFVQDGDFKIEGGQSVAREMLQSSEVPTAVMVANDMMALGVMRECRASGLRIPRDISIVGFDDIAFASLADPPLSTVCLPRDELGRKAVDALMEMIGRPEGPGLELHVETHLVKRGSADAAPAQA